MLARLRLLIAVCLVAPAIVSCTSLGPRANITLRVTNGTCIPGPCKAVEVLAFPVVESTALGFGPYRSIDLGFMAGTGLCVTFPPGDTTNAIWTTAMPVTLGVWDTTTPYVLASPTVGRFVPNEANGWSVTLPQDTAAQPAPPCTP